MNLRENAYDSWSSVDLSGVCESYTFFTPSCASLLHSPHCHTLLYRKVHSLRDGSPSACARAHLATFRSILTCSRTSKTPRVHIVRKQRLAHALRLRLSTSTASTVAPAPAPAPAPARLTCTRRLEVLRCGPPCAQTDADNRLPGHDLRRVDHTVACLCVPRVAVNVASWG